MAFCCVVAFAAIVIIVVITSVVIFFANASARCPHCQEQYVTLNFWKSAPDNGQFVSERLIY
jgi:hypothetical protein